MLLQNLTFHHYRPRRLLAYPPIYLQDPEQDFRSRCILCDVSKKTFRRIFNAFIMHSITYIEVVNMGITPILTLSGSTRAIMGSDYECAAAVAAVAIATIIIDK